MQNEIEELLKNVAIKIAALNEAKRMYANKIAPDFNIFDYLRGDEVGLSRCIASLLDPAGTHGQGSLFLKEFLKRIDNVLSENELIENWTDTVTDGCQVDLEKQANGKRRIDVYLKFSNGEIIGIENKPWAWDQENQLADYAKFIEGQANKKKWLIIYLSKNDPADSNYSIKKEDRELIEKSNNFVWLDYAELVEWLEFCAQNSKALNVRIFIEELAKFVRIKINGELDMSEEKEIKNIILESKESFRSAFHVSKAIKAAKEVLLKELEIDLKESLTRNDLIFDWDENMSSNWKSYVGFNVKFNQEQDFYLRFNFESSNLGSLIWGIRRKNKLITRDAETWNKVNLVMSDKFGSAGKTEWWPWYSEIHNNNDIFDAETQHWDKSEQPWLSIINKEMAGKITTLAILVRGAFDKEENLLIGGANKPLIDQTFLLETQ